MNENEHLLGFLDGNSLDKHDIRVISLLTYIYPDPNIHLLKPTGIKSLPTFKDAYCLFRASLHQETSTISNIMISLRKVVIVVAALIALAAFAHAIPTPGPIASGAITIYPIPQRPPYAPNPWIYPKPTTVQPAGR
ncbi:uncharacterized protein LOC112453666 [Temnothorax curvispinosus]|uniref:Uncharacterized protein LOC112453666 n=1 Tax=Temnothorax curvispinosus TaxID=300111 RepID=A0A6J1PLW1_9HYME|nr:uncharacterized protein LOC112453666 [Temnothorax curvispinosus]